MPPALAPHPDRVATTLATVAATPEGGGPAHAAPAPGSLDCRIDLKLLAWQAQQAAARAGAARDHLARFERSAHPDLWAGTVQDGTARGFCAALEEAVALAPPAEAEQAGDGTEPASAQVFEGRALRRKKDILVSSGGARVRFTRREGLLYVDRRGGVNSSNCLRFEARADLGTLDGFHGDDSARPRLYSAQFLQPVRYEVAPGRAELRLAGRLGRGPVGWDTEIKISGRDDEPQVRLQIRLQNAMRDWRLRARFLGVPPAQIAHDCTDVREIVDNDAGGIVAFTLVRACGRLLVDGETVDVPGAQCQGQIVHRFRLGST